MALTFTVPVEGLEPRQLTLATWIDMLVKAAPAEFNDLALEDFCMAVVMVFQKDLEVVLVSCVGKTNEVRQ